MAVDRRKLMPVLMQLVESQLPPGFGATILVFNFGGGTGLPGEMNYISSANRQDMIHSMEELLEHWKSGRFDDNFSLDN
jgi:hypothetical protein